MISIEILDYVYSADVNNQFNLNNATTLDDWTIESSGEASITTVSGSTQALEPVTGNLTAGVDYKVTLTVSGYSGTGDIGFGLTSVDGTTMGITNAMRLDVDGTVTEQFTAAATNNVKILAEVGSAGTITASLTPVSSIDFSKSVVGSLDIADSIDFPLALTFSISDIRNLDARTGTYSKTFNIPATKNNNNIFRGAYHEGSYIEGNKISTEKNCRILVDNNYSITGKIQVTAIGKSSSPSYYSCVFYGNNVDWASSIGSKLLKDLRVTPSDDDDGSGWDNLNRKGAGTGSGLLIQKDEIVATWSQTDATGASPVVYPIVSYGEYNEGGDAATIQLLRQRDDGAGKYGYVGWDNTNNSYDTPTPSCDWRPCVFIYDVIKQIFIQEGYTITSNFIETASFKKLLMALPNFRYNNVEEREEGATSNTWQGTFFIEAPPTSTGYIENVSFVTPATADDTWVYTTQDIQWGAGSQLVQHDNTAIYDDTTQTFTITEYGFYDIAVDDVGIYLNSTCYSTYTATNIGIGYIGIRVMVKAVGQTSWNKIGIAYILGEDTSYVHYPNCGSLTPGSLRIENMLIENYYLNKGDSIQFEYQTKAKHFSGGSKIIGIDADLFGGTNISDMAASSGFSNRAGRVSIKFKGDVAEYGQTYDLKNVIDSESSQVDFIKGVAHAFNLQFVTNTVARNVEIEPYNDFYRDESLAIDWTDKVDLSQIQEDKFVETELAREIIFKYKTDSRDKKVEARAIRLWSGVIDEYPYREFLSNEFPVGKAVFENPFFAGTYNGRDSQTTGGAKEEQAPYNALLWGFCDTTPPTQPYGGGSCRPAKGYDFVPRLLNWESMSCGSTPVSSVFRQYAVIQIWGDETAKIWTTPFSPARTYEIYPKATSYDKFNNTTEVLTYGTVNIGNWDCTDGFYDDFSRKKGLYQNYYQFMIEQIKSTPRLKTIYLNLKLSDISNLDLRKLVYVSGYYYRINRIVDFQPNNNNTTKVELVLWENKGFFPAAETPGF